METNEKRGFTLSFAYAIEEAYKKDNQGFETVEAFAAHTFAAMVEKALNGEAENFNRNSNRYPAAFHNCHNAVQWLLWCVEEPITANSAIDDAFCDDMGDFIREHSFEIAENHPEMLEDEENFYFLP